MTMTSLYLSLIWLVVDKSNTYRLMYQMAILTDHQSDQTWLISIYVGSLSLVTFREYGWAFQFYQTIPLSLGRVCPPSTQTPFKLDVWHHQARANRIICYTVSKWKELQVGGQKKFKSMQTFLMLDSKNFPTSLGEGRGLQGYRTTWAEEGKNQSYYVKHFNVWNL